MVPRFLRSLIIGTFFCQEVIKLNDNEAVNYVEAKKDLREQLFNLRMKIAVTNDLKLKKKLEEQAKEVHNAYLELGLEEKVLDVDKK